VVTLMFDASADAVPKVHPATREILPDDPMEMHGFEVPGDPQLMLRLLIEEYSRIGAGVDAIMQLACDPNYTVFFALRRSLGDEEFRRQVSSIIARCGVIRVKAKETGAPSENLVQIALPVA
jgi:hypothetical protein